MTLGPDGEGWEEVAGSGAGVAGLVRSEEEGVVVAMSARRPRYAKESSTFEKMSGAGEGVGPTQ